MSQENVDIVRRVYDEISTQRTWPRELFAEDFEFDGTDIALDQGAVIGVAATERVMLPYVGTFDEYAIEIDEVIHADTRLVITAVRDGGRIKGGGATVSNRFFHVWTFRGGEVCRFSSHTDRNRALEAAGLAD
jgi:ketosteroid isomerase-like protein